MRSPRPGPWWMPRACGPKKGGSLTGPSPVDRDRPGLKIHVLSDRNGFPPAVTVSAANTNDNQALKPLVRAVPAIRSRRGPRRRKPTNLHADKAYDSAEIRSRLHKRAIAPRIARKGIESSELLGLVYRLSPPDHPLRTQGLPFRSLPHPRSSHHLLQEASLMRHAPSQPHPRIPPLASENTSGKSPKKAVASATLPRPAQGIAIATVAIKVHAITPTRRANDTGPGGSLKR